MEALQKTTEKSAEINSIEIFLEDIRHYIQSVSPELLECFDGYANEARFGRAWLNNDINRLKPTDEVLEIGAGLMLLACQLRRENIAVTALEPVGSGFSHFYKLQELIYIYAKANGIMPCILPYPAEILQLQNQFAFAYSINVMEHVADVKTVIKQVYTSLKLGGNYHFVCPNYAFPYESHFGLPILGNKQFTWYLMRRWIEHSHYTDPVGLWDSLNWITVAKIKKYAHQLMLTDLYFDRIIFFTYISRIIEDKALQGRHSRIIYYFFRTIKALGILSIIRFIPIRFLPVMDCRITRTN